MSETKEMITNQELENQNKTEPTTSTEIQVVKEETLVNFKEVKKRERILIIDQFRGLLIFWICLAKFFPPKWAQSNYILQSLFTRTDAPLSWSDPNWQNFRIFDCVTPCFMFLIGMLLRKKKNYFLS